MLIQKLRSKIIFQMILIQLSLVLYLTQIWTQYDLIFKTDNNILWPAYLIIYEIFGEILPILIYCYVLLSQIKLFRTKKNKDE